MLRTHVAIVAFFILLFLPHISSKFIFVIVALAATYLPDIDTGFSTLGKSGVGTVTQFFTRHRGVLHSFSFCIPISLLFAWFIPVLALPFFLGYSLHIFSDSFTKDGVRPFWPMKFESKWHFRTGGLTESTSFIILLVMDLIAFILVAPNIF